MDNTEKQPNSQIPTGNLQSPTYNWKTQGDIYKGTDTRTQLDNIVNDLANHTVQQELGNIPFSKQWQLFTSGIPDSVRNPFLDDLTKPNSYTPNPPIPFNPTAGMLSETDKRSDLGDIVEASAYLNNMTERILMWASRKFVSLDDLSPLDTETFNRTNSELVNNFFTKKGYIDNLQKSPEGKEILSNYAAGEYDGITSYDNLLQAISFDMAKINARKVLSKATGAAKYMGSFIGGTLSDPLVLAAGVGAGAIAAKAGIAIGADVASASIAREAAGVAGESLIFSAIDAGARSVVMKEKQTIDDVLDNTVTNLMMSAAVFGGLRAFNKASAIANEQINQTKILEYLAAKKADLYDGFKVFNDVFTKDQNTDFGIKYNKYKSDIIASYELNMASKYPNMGVDALNQLIENEFNKNMADKLFEVEYVTPREISITDNLVNIEKKFKNLLGEEKSNRISFVKQSDDTWMVDATHNNPLTNETIINSEAKNIEFSNDEMNTIIKALKENKDLPTEITDKIDKTYGTHNLNTEGGTATSTTNNFKDQYGKAYKSNIPTTPISKAVMDTLSEKNPTIKNLFGNIYDRIVIKPQWRAAHSIYERLDRMDKRGRVYAEAIKEVKANGISETDPRFEKAVNDNVAARLQATADRLGYDNTTSKNAYYYTLFQVPKHLVSGLLTGVLPIWIGFGFLSGIINGTLDQTIAKFTSKIGAGMNPMQYGISGSANRFVNPDLASLVPFVYMNNREMDNLKNTARLTLMDNDLHNMLLKALPYMSNSQAKTDALSIIKIITDNPGSMDKGLYMQLNEKMLSAFMSTHQKDVENSVKTKSSVNNDMIQKLQLGGQLDAIHLKIAEATSGLTPEFRKAAMRMIYNQSVNGNDPLIKLKDSILSSINNPLRENIDGWNRNFNCFYDEVAGKFNSNNPLWNNIKSALYDKLSIDDRVVSGINGVGAGNNAITFINSVGSHLVTMLNEVIDHKYDIKNENINNVDRYYNSMKTYGNDDNIKESLIEKATSILSPNTVPDQDHRKGAFFPQNHDQLVGYTAILSNYPNMAIGLADGTISNTKFNALYNMVGYNDLLSVGAVARALNARDTSEQVTDTKVVKDDSSKRNSNNSNDIEKQLFNKVKE